MPNTAIEMEQHAAQKLLLYGSASTVAVGGGLVAAAGILPALGPIGGYLAKAAIYSGRAVGSGSLEVLGYTYAAGQLLRQLGSETISRTYSVVRNNWHAIVALSDIISTAYDVYEAAFRENDKVDPVATSEASVTEK